MAVQLSNELDTTIAITGDVDLITHGGRVCMVHNGHPLMGYVTGTGCTASAIIGAFLAVDREPVDAATTALAYFGLTGEKGVSSGAEAPGSFQMAMLDALYTIDGEQLEKGSKIQS